MKSVSKKRLLLVVSLLIPALLLFALPVYEPGDLPYLLLLIGRFHPVILHFPIVLIILALILELMRRSRMLRKADNIVSVILLAAAFSSIVGIGSGYLLYASGDYSGVLMEQHMWIGVITGVLILITCAVFLLYRETKKFYALYMAGLILSNGAVALASHLGGSLTHGEDYLTEYVPMLTAKTEPVKQRSEAEMLVYEDVIVPVFEAKCVSCHSDRRAKGDFSMSSYDKMEKGGESGNKGIIPGNADSSEVYKRIVLPEYHEDRMPPEGKLPMTMYETGLLKYWIQNGASRDLQVAQLNQAAGIKDTIAKVLPELARYRRKQEVSRAKNEQLKRELQQLAFRLNITIEADTSAEEDMFAVAMKFPPAALTGAQLNDLAAYGDVFSKLSLVASGIEDDGLYHISRMPNVKSLFLQKTRVNGSGLVHLQKLEKLEVLNLSYSQVDDKAALDLLKIPNLREVYLFQSKTSVEVARALQAYKPSLKVMMEEGPYW